MARTSARTRAESLGRARAKARVPCEASKSHTAAGRQVATAMRKARCKLSWGRENSMGFSWAHGHRGTPHVLDREEPGAGAQFAMRFHAGMKRWAERGAASFRFRVRAQERAPLTIKKYRLPAWVSCMGISHTRTVCFRATRHLTLSNRTQAPGT